MTKYQEEFRKIAYYIEANLDSDIELDELCKMACLSKFHFHRQCSAYFGMSVMSLAKVLRMKRAAHQLAYRNAKIIDIALTAGYESHEGFTRAFRRYFGMNPSAFAADSDWSYWQTKYDPITRLRNKPMQGKLKVEIVDFPETLIATMQHRGSPQTLTNTINQFISWRKANHLPPSKSRTFNLIYDDPSITKAEDFRFDLACSITQNIENASNNGIVQQTIPSGKCAQIQHLGSDDTIGTSIAYLYADWLESSGYTLRDFPLFIERLNFFPEVLESEVRIDIYLPIA